MSPQIREVLPGELRLPPSRTAGADPWKLHLQIHRFGNSSIGMPPIQFYEDPDGILEIMDGVTRATRIAKLAPELPGSTRRNLRCAGIAPGTDA